MPTTPPSQSRPPHRIELKLREVSQFFNTMDPSPFHEKDLDTDAEEYIVSWASEFPLEEPAILVVHLSHVAPGVDAQQLIEQAMHHYFSHRAELKRMEFRRLMKDGRLALFIGVTFLTTCLFLSSLIAKAGPTQITGILCESLTIAGWVAMWKPLQIYLYEWWPVRYSARIYMKMSRMKVEVRLQEHDAGDVSA